MSERLFLFHMFTSSSPLHSKRFTCWVGWEKVRGHIENIALFMQVKRRSSFRRAFYWQEALSIYHVRVIQFIDNVIGCFFAVSIATGLVQG